MKKEKKEMRFNCTNTHRERQMRKVPSCSKQSYTFNRRKQRSMAMQNRRFNTDAVDDDGVDGLEESSTSSSRDDGVIDVQVRQYVDTVYSWDPHWQFAIHRNDADDGVVFRYSTLKSLVINNDEIDSVTFPTTHWLSFTKRFDTLEDAMMRANDIKHFLQTLSNDVLSDLVSNLRSRE